MDKKVKNKKGGKLKSFLNGVVEKLDKKMKEKAKSSGCCSGGDLKGPSCCS